MRRRPPSPGSGASLPGDGGRQSGVTAGLAARCHSIWRRCAWQRCLPARMWIANRKWSRGLAPPGSLDTIRSRFRMVSEKEILVDGW